MKKLLFPLAILSVITFSCSKDLEDGPMGADSSYESLSDPSFIAPPDGSGGGQNGSSGVMTAGEWNDLDNWTFWSELCTGSNSEMPAYWGLNTLNRYSFVIKDQDGDLIPDCKLELKDASGVSIWKAVSDNAGKAEMFCNVTISAQTPSSLTVFYNDNSWDFPAPFDFDQGCNYIGLPVDHGLTSNNVDIVFTVDATGSMGDEINYLKSELSDVMSRVMAGNPALNVRLGSVFYRDSGDEYVTRISPLTNDVGVALSFINQQSSGGGGDYPEAVDVALEASLQQMAWSSNARTRIVFLILDAPPHYEPVPLMSIRSTIASAAEKGIKIIPVTASGIDKNTEFLMRFMAILSNGTYTFVTDHSGIGGDHLEPTVGNYEVEYLNDLLVRLVEEYSE